MSKTYEVWVPIAGHACVAVEADSEDEAIEKVLENGITLNDIEEYEALKAFNTGNVCHCPMPWEISADEIE